ncbi:MAG TPA: hypothetical protein VK447_11475 [Myxococcaceae bacterium]|nr:hypothetical protein [Myxococcaceae bacterium]
MSRPSSRWCLLAALALWGQGCEQRSAQGDKPEQAKEAVRRFFAALPSGDCAVLGRMILSDPPGRECRSVVDELNRHGVRLVEVLDAQVDGRNADAVIVRARMSEGSKPKDAPSLYRVEKHPSGWKLRL